MKQEMKNIHVLPTDKPSRLVGSRLNLSLKDIPISGFDAFKTYNIYITSDEEIKEGTWYITVLDNEIYKADEDTERIMSVANKCDNTTYKRTHFKIILTTDQDLIKDGVQAIDDEFLEWFVKNPSCKEVEIKTEYLGSKCLKCGFVENHDEVDTEYCPKCKNYTYEHLYNHNKIIIPKEELKSFSDFSDKFFGSIPKEEPHPKVLSENGSELFFDKQGNLIKQETLEEAAEKYSLELLEAKTIQHHEKTWIKSMFIHIAKWQAKKMFSEQDMIEFGEWCENLQKDKKDIRRTNPDITRKELLELWKKEFKNNEQQ